MKEKKILEVAKYIIENNATIEMASNHFEISISSIKKYINDKGNLQSIDIEIYNEVKKVQQYLIGVGQRIGGKNGVGVARSKHTEYEAMEIAETMIEENLTVKQASDMFAIPTSTLYEMITSINDAVIREELKLLFAENDLRFGHGNKR